MGHGHRPVTRRRLQHGADVSISSFAVYRMILIRYALTLTYLVGNPGCNLFHALYVAFQDLDP